MKYSVLALAVLSAFSMQAMAWESESFNGTYDTIHAGEGKQLLVTNGNTATSLDGKVVTEGIGYIQNGGTLILASDDASITTHGNFYVGGDIKGVDGGDLQNLTFNGGDMTLYDATLKVAGTYTHHSTGGYGAGYLCVENKSVFEATNFVADSYYSLKVSSQGVATINNLTAAGIVRNAAGGTLNIGESARIGHLWNMSTLNAENATVVLGTEDEAMLPHDYAGNLIELNNGEVYVFGNGIDRDGDKVANSVMKVGTLIVKGNAMNADAADLIVNNMTVEKTFDNQTGATLAVNDGRAEVNKLAGEQGSIVLTNAALSAATSSDFGSVEANQSAIEVGGGFYTFTALTGEGKTLTLTDLPNTEGVTINGKDGELIVGTNADSNDHFDSASEAADKLLEVVEGLEEKDKVVIAPGAVNDGLTGIIMADGTLGEKTVQANPAMEAFTSVSALMAFQWRHDMNDLTKRMGELRTSPEGVGAWVRVYGSEQEYGAQSVTAKNNSVQIGADVDVGMGWKVGAAFNYTDGQSSYDGGEADNKAYGIAAYGTWFAENGQFVDLIAKYSRLDTDFALNGMDGSYDNNAWSVSAEYGWHWKVADVAFVEPQVEVTYGQVIGDDFTTANGVSIEQDDFESLIGRVGLRSGFYFPDNKGVIYARASVLHDFKGEMDSTARHQTAHRDLKADLGGTWFEWGFGANFNVTPNTYAYVDLERTNGGEVVENWRYNAGIRHVF